MPAPLKPLKPNEKKLVRTVIASFCLKAEVNQLVWNYTDARPFRGFMTPPDQPHANDCSGYDSLAFNWAMHWAKVYVADPLDEHYSGWGNTSTIFEFLKEYDAPANKYLIGDIALYDLGTRHAHTTICRKAGSVNTAIFSSNGNESAPEGLRVDYRPGLEGVFRHPQLR